MRDNAAEFANALETGAYNVVENGVSVVKRIPPEWAGVLGISEEASRFVVHHGNTEDWGSGAPWVKRQTSAPEHHHAGYLEDYQDTSRGRWSGPLKTPEQKRAFQEGRDIPEETAPDNIVNLNATLNNGT